MINRPPVQKDVLRCAFDIPSKTVARALQHDRSRANEPLASQCVAYASKAQDLRTRQIKRVPI